MKLLFIFLLFCVAFVPPFVEAKGSMWGLEQMISYKSGDSIRIMADSFKSRRRLYPMNFYDFPFSAPDKEIVDSFKKKENLGEILLGHRLVPTNFEVKVLENTPNWVKTNTVPLNTIGTRAKLYSLLVNRYRSSFFLDGLPALVETGDRKYNGVSFQMGKKADKGFVLNNAFHFKIFYSTVSDNADLVVITRVVVAASSVSDADPEEPLYLSVNMLREEPKVPFTTYYKVSWEEGDDEVTWKTRWDVYATLIRPRRDKGHYLSTAFSILLVCFLGTLVALVLARTVRRDLLDMTDGDTREDLREEKGWKLVRGDVFRTPKNAGILSSLIGGGCQLLAMIAVTSIASVVGILHPSQRGNLLTGLIMFFIVSSSIAGFVVSTMLRYFGQVSFKKALLYSLYLPISIFSGYLCLNMLHWWRHSTTAIPFTTLLTLIALEICLALPLVSVGVMAGFKKTNITPPTRVGLVPRLIPEQADRKVLLLSVCASLVPFAAAQIELSYIMGSFWMGITFYRLGLLAVVALIIGVICCEVSVVLTYATLTLEDHHWWWRSFGSLATCGVLTFIYSLYYLVANLEISAPGSVILYIGYMLGASTLLGLITGTLGFLSSAFFVYFIYSYAKVE